MTNKHTPGPWRVMRRANQCGTQAILVVGGANHPQCKLEENQWKNANLIAASPDLFNALQVLLFNQTIVDHLSSTDPKALEQARAAIGKAIGEE
jgi:hypothetical protein